MCYTEIAMELLPPISASLGAMVSLARKLDALHLDTELTDEVKKLKTRLLKLSKAREPPATVSIWMDDVRELSYDMDNWVDAGEEDWIDQMPGFKARAKEANDRFDRYIPEIIPSSTDVVPIADHQLLTVEGGRKQTDLVVGLYGTGGPVDRIGKLLIDEDEQLKVLSVVGVGGIGKTTLVKQLWRKHKSGDHFDCRAFVRTAKKPDMRRILRSILAQVRPHQPPDANEVHELIHDLNEHLQDKRYFLIIDDLWATSVWNVASRAFPEGNHGSRIITTTEIKDVALACCSYQSTCLFEMVPLSDIQSKELLNSAVFWSGEHYSRQLKGVTDEIIRRCAGLPQAIISLSSVLASQGEANSVQKKEQLLDNLPTNTTPDDILKQVLKVCYNCLPSCLQTCLLYLSLYPENYMILKEDIIKQWVAEGFILAPTDNDQMKVAGSYFDKLVNIGLIQRIDVDYGDEVLYYAVHHMVHDLITSNSIEENFVTTIDYSERTVRFSNNVCRLSLQFGSATHATSPESTTTGLSQVRSLAFFGLISCQPSIFGFKLLRYLILHIWADQPSTGIDLRRISELFLLRSLQVTCNHTVLLPDLMQGPKHLETLEINARVASIPSNIVHLRSWLHLRLRVGTELPDVTGVLTNVNQNPSSAAILLDESSSPPDSVRAIELLPPICIMPKWIGQLTNLRILKCVVRELQRDDISNLQRLPLNVLSLYVQLRDSTESISFISGSFAALEYFEFRCAVLRLMFHKGTMPNLQRLGLGFNAHRGQYGCSLLGIEDMSNVHEISAIIGVATDTGKDDFEAAESRFMKAFQNHHNKVSVKRGHMLEEEYGPKEEPEEHMSLEPVEISGSQQTGETPLEVESSTHSLDGHNKPWGRWKELFMKTSVAHMIDFRSKHDRKRYTSSGHVRRFTYRKLEKATRNFANMLGQGAFWDVYKGVVILQDGEMAVAIKKHKLATSSKEARAAARAAFNNEIEIMSPLNHCNIIRLLGWCDERDNLLLVYELVEDQSLETRLYAYGIGSTVDVERYGARARGSSLALHWQKRYNILLGIASGLEYLHTKCAKAVLHRDIKPANVMLDRNFNAKLCDFGLVTQLTHAITSRETEVVIGTRAYMDPLFKETSKITIDYDVYSFGVLLLEVVCGTRPVPVMLADGKLTDNTLIDKVRKFHERNAILDAAHELLRGEHKEFDTEIEGALLIGLRCVEERRGHRPTIQIVLSDLLRLTANSTAHTAPAMCDEV